MRKRNQEPEDNRYGNDESDAELGEMLGVHVPGWRDDDGLIYKEPPSALDNALADLDRIGELLTPGQKRFADVLAWILVVVVGVAVVAAVVFILIVVAVGAYKGILS